MNLAVLQAILLATDCNPRWLTKHLPNLAHSKEVPLIFVKDKKGASLRLGELLKLKTAIAIGVKVGAVSLHSVTFFLPFGHLYIHLLYLTGKRKYDQSICRESNYWQGNQS